MRLSVARALRALGALAAVLALSAPLGALAQSGQVLINQVMLKAQQGEAEAGFCASTGWRVETPATLAANTRFYDVARVGSAKTFVDTAGSYCAYLRVEEIYSDAGRRCVRVQMWSCKIGGSCASGTAQGCRGDQMYDWK